MNEAGTRFWLLRPVIAGRWGRMWTGLLIFTGSLALFVVFDDLFQDSGSDQRVADGVAIFFCLILAYIVPIHHLIIERSLNAFDQLTPSLTEPATLLDQWRRRIERKSTRWNLLTLSLGVFAGVAHNFVLLAGSSISDVFSSVGSTLPILFTLLIWITMTVVISSLIDNAMLFRRLAARVRIDLLDARRVLPFGAVAVSSTLAMIGAQASFPALIVESDVSYITFVPGLIATGLPMLFLFFLPIWPVHTRIVARKKMELERIRKEIAGLCESGASDQPGLGDLAPVLIYRREIAEASEWPFDMSVMGRLALYLIIPPLTWIGAALIEILIDSAI